VELIGENLSVSRGERMVISGLSFRVAGGEALLLTGPNGSGKTTLIRTIAGFLSPAAGRIVLDGGDDECGLAEHCHYVGHLNGVKPGLSASENLRFWARYLAPGIDESSISERSQDALGRFGLGAIAHVASALLSAGQKRRLGLARLLVAARDIWLLDEPTVSLDAASADLLRDLIGHHLSSGGIVLAATHLPLGIEGADTLDLGSKGAEAGA
jgi:heme exporter protein A